jgi:hypothetical protein
VVAAAPVRQRRQRRAVTEEMGGREVWEDKGAWRLFLLAVLAKMARMVVVEKRVLMVHLTREETAPKG